MLLFYDNDFSTCAEKVRFILNETGRSWQTKWLNLREGDQFDPAFRKINPAAVVPVIVDGEQIVTESSLILEYLDETRGGGPSFMPSAPWWKFKARFWMKRLDAGLHLNIAALSIPIVFRHEHASKTEAEMNARIEANPNPVLREIWRSAVATGLDNDYFRGAARSWDDAISTMNDELATQPWVAGETLSVADISLIPYIVRLDTLGLFERMSAARPHVIRWYEAMKQRSAFRKTFAETQDPERVAFVRGWGEHEKDLIGRILAPLGGMNGTPRDRR